MSKLSKLLCNFFVIKFLKSILSNFLKVSIKYLLGQPIYMIRYWLLQLFRKFSFSVIVSIMLRWFFFILVIYRYKIAAICVSPCILYLAFMNMYINLSISGFVCQLNQYTTNSMPLIKHFKMHKFINFYFWTMFSEARDEILVFVFS